MAIVSALYTAAIVGIAIILAVWLIADALPSERCQCWTCRERRARGKK